MFTKFIISDIATKRTGVISWKKMTDEATFKLVAKKRKLKAKREVVLTYMVHCCNTKGASKSITITDIRFRKINEACNIRKKNETDFKTYGHIIKNISDEDLDNVHGYHRLFYQKFINVSKVLKHQATTNTNTII